MALEVIQQVYRGNTPLMCSAPGENRRAFGYWAVRIANGEKALSICRKPHKSTIHIDSGVAVVDQPLLQIKVAPAFKRSWRDWRIQIV
jgi:hypothetical protein